MCIGSKRFIISLALIASLVLPSVSFAAQGRKTANAPSSDWSRLNTVVAGSMVAVKLKNGSVSDTVLSLSVKTNLLT